MKKKLLAFCLVLGLSLVITAPALAEIYDPLGLQYGEYTGLGSNDIRFTIANVINVALSLLGVLTLALIVYAGYMWMTAAGNQDQADKAKKIIYFAVIGLLIIMLSYSITRFVVSSFDAATGVQGAPVGS